MHNVTAEINGTEMSWTDICNKFPEDSDTCLGNEGILRFGYAEVPWEGLGPRMGPPEFEWSPDSIASDAELLEMVQTGTTGQSVIELKAVLGGTVPEEITQDLDTGENDIRSAKSAIFGYPYSYGDYTSMQLMPMEKELEVQAELFNENSEYVNIYLFTPNGLMESFAGDMMGDLMLV